MGAATNLENSSIAWSRGADATTPRNVSQVSSDCESETGTWKADRDSPGLVGW
jgi:hypothetical protein